MILKASTGPDGLVDTRSERAVPGRIVPPKACWCWRDHPRAESRRVFSLPRCFAFKKDSCATRYAHLIFPKNEISKLLNRSNSDQFGLRLKFLADWSAKGCSSEIRPSAFSDSNPAAIAGPGQEKQPPPNPFRVQSPADARPSAIEPGAAASTGG